MITSTKLITTKMLDTTYTTTTPATPIILYASNQTRPPILYGTISVSFSYSANPVTLQIVTIAIGTNQYPLTLLSSCVYGIPLNYSGNIELTYIAPLANTNFTISAILSAVYAVGQTTNCNIDTGCCA
ncbi:MAG: hypothetical protein RLZ12_247 [Bacillota bacterium]|jgi:hypothetical protein